MPGSSKRNHHPHLPSVLPGIHPYTHNMPQTSGHCNMTTNEHTSGYSNMTNVHIRHTMHPCHPNEPYGSTRQNYRNQMNSNTVEKPYLRDYIHSNFSTTEEMHSCMDKHYSEDFQL